MKTKYVIKYKDDSYFVYLSEHSPNRTWDLERAHLFDSRQMARMCDYREEVCQIVQVSLTVSEDDRSQPALTPFEECMRLRQLSLTDPLTGEQLERLAELWTVLTESEQEALEEGD